MFEKAMQMERLPQALQSKWRENGAAAQHSAEAEEEQRSAAQNVTESFLLGFTEGVRMRLWCVHVFMKVRFLFFWVV